jgi:hypothetical protein
MSSPIYDAILSAKDAKSILLVSSSAFGIVRVVRDFVRTTVNKDPIISRQIYRLAGLPAEGFPLRVPHHTVSTSSMIGDGRTMNPGEASLAHGGVMFLDDITEFRKDVLEVISYVHKYNEISYLNSPYLKSLPADFMLIGFVNVSESTKDYREYLRMFNFDVEIKLDNSFVLEIISRKF